MEFHAYFGCFHIDYLWEAVPECRNCVSNAIRSPATFAQPSIPPPEQIPAQERGEVTVSFGGTLACSPQEQNTKTDSTRKGRK